MDILNTPLGQLGIVGVLLLACGALFTIIIRVQAKKYDDMVTLKDTEYKNMVDVKNGLISAANLRGDEWMRSARAAEQGRETDRQVLGEQFEALAANVSKLLAMVDPHLKIPTISPRTGHNASGEVDHVGA